MSYQDFASVYDRLMMEVDYQAWAKSLQKRLEIYGIKDGLLLDLGCGTGSMTLLLAQAGYDMIGIDNSSDMLEVARQKAFLAGCQDILFLQQDMESFELYGTVRGIISTCDCMNYLLDLDTVQKVCALALNYLDYDGIFIFDILLPYYYQEVLGNQTYVRHWEEGSYIWENTYDSLTRLNQCDLSIFVEEESGLYRGIFEEHTQRGYFLEEIKEVLEKVGFEDISFFHEISMEPATSTSQRVTCQGFKRNKRKRV